MKLQGRELSLSKKIGKAITDYKMFSEGDRIAVGVSGGKDSLSLLHFLHRRQAFTPLEYSILAVHIDLGDSSSSLKKLEAYFKNCSFKYTVRKLRIPVKEKTCFWCSWNRRKMLFETAAKYKCNKVALGHHLDDIVQTILLNLFFKGEISAMSPKQKLFKGVLTIIRPLAYLQEKEIASFARQQKLPLFQYRCPNSLTSKRRKIGGIISDLEKSCPSVKTNIFRSIKRIRKEYLL